MKFSPPLIKTTLLKRYKRFLADVVSDELGEFTAHCPNTGSMKNYWQEGDTAWRRTVSHLLHPRRPLRAPLTILRVPIY